MKSRKTGTGRSVGQMRKFLAVFFVMCILLSASSAFAAKTIKLSHLNPQQPFDVATAHVFFAETVASVVSGSGCNFSCGGPPVRSSTAFSERRFSHSASCLCSASEKPLERAF